MRRIITALFVLSRCFVTYGQTTLNANLKIELDSLYAADQKYRALLFI